MPSHAYWAAERRELANSFSFLGATINKVGRVVYSPVLQVVAMHRHAKRVKRAASATPSEASLSESDAGMEYNVQRRPQPKQQGSQGCTISGQSSGIPQL
jgi:hypothetical protein